MTKFAFIDSQNLKKSVEEIGKEIDYRRFRLWLRNKKGVDRAIMYFGYMRGQQAHYEFLEQCGFELVFRPVEERLGRKKANVDICLTISVLDQVDDITSAYLVTSDGDFYDLALRLEELGKFGGVISPSSPKNCSALLKKICGARIDFVPSLIGKFEVR